MWNIVAPEKGTSPLNKHVEGGITLHEKAENMPALPLGPFVRRPDGAVVGVGDNEIVISTDEGRSWSTLADKPVGEDVKIRTERALLHVQKGKYGSADIGTMMF
jgi:hypothetical protein